MGNEIIQDVYRDEDFDGYRELVAPAPRLVLLPPPVLVFKCIGCGESDGRTECGGLKCHDCVSS